MKKFLLLFLTANLLSLSSAFAFIDCTVSDSSGRVVGTFAGGCNGENTTLYAEGMSFYFKSLASEKVHVYVASQKDGSEILYATHEGDRLQAYGKVRNRASYYCWSHNHPYPR